MQDQVAPAPRARPLDEAAPFYEALWPAAQKSATRWPLAIIVEVAMIVAWSAIRTTAGADGRVYVLWVVAAGTMALATPRAGLRVVDVPVTIRKRTAGVTKKGTNLRYGLGFLRMMLKSWLR